MSGSAVIDWIDDKAWARSVSVSAGIAGLTAGPTGLTAGAGLTAGLAGQEIFYEKASIRVDDGLLSL